LYVGEHYGVVDKVEWVDDTSANLVFMSESIAQEALISLSAVPIADPTQLPALECLPAKPISAKPEVSLQVRLAVASDRKQAGAAARSRFYLLHPEHDPEERRRREGGRNRYRERDSRGYRGRGRDERRYHSDEEDEGETGPTYFDASFYDDDEQALASRTRPRSSSPRRGTERIGFEGDKSSRELFPDRLASARQRGCRRSRSASPARTRDGHQGRDILHDNRSEAERIKNRLGENGAKELFPSKTSVLGVSQLDQLESATRSTRISDSTTPSSFQIKGMAANSDTTTGGGLSIKGTASATTSAKELFPGKFGSNAGKELFSSRLEGRGRPRQKAEDLFY